MPSCEGIPFLVLKDAGDDLGEAAVAEAHGKDHRADREKSGIMDVEKDRGHSESHEAQWCGV